MSTTTTPATSQLELDQRKLAEYAAEIAALREALRFLLEELNPEIGLESAVSQELYDDRRPRRAALLSQLRAARAALANKGANPA